MRYATVLLCECLCDSFLALVNQPASMHEAIACRVEPIDLAESRTFGVPHPQFGVFVVVRCPIHKLLVGCGCEDFSFPVDEIVGPNSIETGGTILLFEQREGFDGCTRCR